MYRFLEGTADQYMTRAVTTVTRQTTMHELEALFEKHDFNSFPVVEEGKMLGIVTKFDFLRAFAFTTGQMVPHYDDLMQRPVAEMMTEAVVHVEPTAPLTRVLQLMVSLKSRSFPVIGPDRQLVGIISRKDVIRPVDCFYEGENMLVIHPHECIDCGVCVPECPVDAIKPDTDPGLEEWLSLNTFVCTSQIERPADGRQTTGPMPPAASRRPGRSRS